MTKIEKRVLEALERLERPEHVAAEVGITHARVLEILAGLEAKRLVRRRSLIVFAREARSDKSRAGL
jgi:hypothetical protein